MSVKVSVLGLKLIKVPEPSAGPTDAKGATGLPMRYCCLYN